MTEVLRHRGPDEDGLHESAALSLGDPGETAGAALGFRRLSIIDVAGSHQPMSNEDGSVWVVFNGEIYNYQVLRRRLEGAGHTFRTRGDTETLLHLYEDEGPGFARHLEGMFAAAIWDRRRRQLVLVRDRLGKKPLVYRLEPGRLLFASELKGLLAVPGVPRELDPGALDAYLAYQYVPHPQTILRGIHKLPPAHYAVYRNGTLSLHRYWQPDFNYQQDLPADTYIRELRERLTAAVRKRLQSEVPLGAFLSGGIDSSLVVGLMSRLCTEPVQTFSIGFPVAEYDETRYARAVAQRFHTRHREFRVEPSAVDILPQLVWHFDEPFADSSAIPTWYVSKLTREHVTVALTGDGGDELFCGYPRYLAVQVAAWHDRWPAGLRQLLASRFWQRLPTSSRQKSLLRRFKRLAGALSQPPVRRYFDWVSIFNEAARANLYSEDFLACVPDRDPCESLAAAFHAASRRDPVTQAAIADLLTYLPCDLLNKVDIASMAHSLECRCPFLDHHVVELAAAMPLKYKLRRGRGKWILRKAFADLLPPSVRRRGKMGFGVPLGRWFRSELKEFARQVLLDPSTLARGYFQPQAVQQLFDDHQSGRFDHSYRLWSLMVLELWQRQWLDPVPRQQAALAAGDV
jgi:asparagine synthase (glutamine-hydrolysing)